MLEYYLDSIYSCIKPSCEVIIVNKYYKYFLKPDSSKKVSEDAKWKIMIYSHLYFVKNIKENFMSVWLRKYSFK